MRKEYEKKIKEITNEFETQIKQLKSQNATDELEKRYKLQMEKMRKEAEQEKLRLVETYEKEANKKKLEHEAAMSKLALESSEALANCRADHERQIIEITKKLEGDLTRMNDMLLNEKEEHFMTKMSKEEKIQYLTQKIM